jgi:hypothetical protein
MDGEEYVIRDEARDVIIVGAGHQKNARDALQMEVYACSKGIQAAAEKGMTRVTLEIDSLILKKALESDSYRFAEVGGMLYEMKNVFSSHFSNFFCSFGPRTCNKVAHALATDTTGNRAFAESRHPLGEALFTHGGAFTESSLGEALSTECSWQRPFCREPWVPLSVHVRQEPTIVLDEGIF